MTATGQNFSMYQGDTKTIEVTVTDTSGGAVDITGATITWVIYKRTPGNIVLTKTTGGGITITDPTHVDGGKFEISLIPANTATFLGTYNHECELIDLNSNESTIFVGKVEFYQSKA